MKTRFVVGVLLLMAASELSAGGNPESPSDLLDSNDATGFGGVEFEEDRRLTASRMTMVSEQIEARGVVNRDVLKAMRSVPRHLFMPDSQRSQAYEDHPVPIGEGQTISQPYIVALMTEALDLESDDRVLEIGTGSGYQAAVLATIVDEVYSIEIQTPLHQTASRTLDDLGYANVKTKNADGYYGWEEQGPFDAVMITAAIDHIPRPLLDQLVDGGHIILPMGDPYGFQDLVLVQRQGDDYPLEYITGVLFVPMTGRALK